MNRLEEHRTWVRQELERCVAFWLENGMDSRYGGVMTCLDEKGEVYSTDKSVWMQGRCAWIFSYLCHVYGRREEWIRAARSCLDFLEAHCIDREAGNRMYYTVTREGVPLTRRNFCFSESFYAIAAAEYYGVTGETVWLHRAREAYALIWNLMEHKIPDPAGNHGESIPGGRVCRSLANPMIYLNTSMILRRIDPERREVYEARLRQCTGEILRYHRKKELHCMLETVGPEGEYLRDVAAGRVVNPGHDIECSWFLMEWANADGEKALHEEAEAIFTDAVNAGWDTVYGGLLYFLDSENRPCESTEHDLKRWWPQAEVLIASLMAYRDTGKAEYLGWFERELEFVRQRMSDPVNGEWWGILRRDGMRSDPAFKGSTTKGPFHVPRMLILVDRMLTECIGDEEDAMPRKGAAGCRS